MLDERMVLTGDPAGHSGGIGRSDLVVERNTMRGGSMIHTVEAPHEIEMPPAATELAIGDDMQARGLLLGHKLGDKPVLDSLQRRGIDGAGGKIGTRLLQLGRTQIGTDHIGAERRIMRICHCFSPSTCSRWPDGHTTKATADYPMPTKPRHAHRRYPNTPNTREHAYTKQTTVANHTRCMR